MINRGGAEAGSDLLIPLDLLVNPVTSCHRCVLRKYTTLSTWLAAQREDERSEGATFTRVLLKKKKSVKYHHADASAANSFA